MNQPKALVIVAWLFIASGVASIIAIVGNLLIGHNVDVDLGVIDLWIGQGLLHGQPKWRRWALLVLRLGFVILPIVLILPFFGPRVLEARLFNRPMGSIPREYVVACSVLALAVAVWQYRVLQRPAVRAVFEPPPDAGTQNSSSA